MTETHTSAAPAHKPFRRLLLTGAAGNLGAQLRGALGSWADAVRLSDIAPLGDLACHEEASAVDLADRDAVDALLEGVDAVVHLGAFRSTRRSTICSKRISAACTTSLRPRRSMV